jgi:hypothetical protein
MDFPKKLKALCAGVFLVGTVTAVVAYAINNRTHESRARVGFTMRSKQSFTPTGGGKPRLDAFKVRYQSSDGGWKEETTYYNTDGTVKRDDSSFGQVGRGVFQIDKEKGVLIFLPPMEVQALSTPSPNPHDDPHFVGEDSVLGYYTYVFHFPDDDGQGYVESYYAPRLQNFPIKTAFVSKLGVEVIEPIDIVLREPDASVFASLPNWPVSYDHFQDKIKALEDAGKGPMADEMRRALKKQLRQEP